ncbi:unnamed protein product [Leuciscus chuanchicus]
MDSPHEKFCTTLSALDGSPAWRKHVFLERKFNGASSLSGPWEKPLSSSTALCITAPSQPCLELSARWIEFPQDTYDVNFCKRHVCSNVPVFSTAVLPLSEAMNSHDLLQGRLNTAILHLLV